ncbi:MAG: hypothetical protein WC359_12650 [Dehalococcoidia bacterium]|jgi:hypothetical protein
MDFQLSLPYATDSGLHVIQGLDVTGTPIYQRAGDWRCKPVDMYTLLQGIIERCLATQQPDGSYLVSPTIFDETMFSTDEHIPYAPISKWTERTYPDGVLNEVSGYVANLMDNYPASLLLLAIDDKIWQLGYCVEGPIHPVSVYGTLSDTSPFFVPYDDPTAIFQAAGVGYDPVTNQLQIVPARITGGDPIYGSPEGATRIYPELLIDRYKILQVLRWKKANIGDTRRYAGSAVGFSDPEYTDNHGYYISAPSWWTTEYVEGLHAIACQRARDDWTETVGAVEDATLAAYWAITRGCRNYTRRTGYLGAWYSRATDGYNGLTNTHNGPKLLIYQGYADIPHDVKIWAYWDGAGDYQLWQQFGGGDLVAGKNLLLEIDDISEDTVWQAGFENAESTLHFPPLPVPWTQGIDRDSQLAIASEWPVEDWKFEFCKHDDNGGAVTWGG